MSKKFQVIVADPPWVFDDLLTMSDVPRGADANYDTMTNQDILDLNVQAVADLEGCVLALWVPSSILQTGLDVMKAWGFEHKQTYVWVKTKKTPLSDLIKIFKASKLTDQNYKSHFNQLMLLLANVKMSSILSFYMGRIFRQTHEICLIGINNTKIYKNLANKSQRSVSFGTNLKHSAKPEHLQDSLDIMFPNGEKFEMFARRLRSGWTCVGNEVCDGEDIRDSLKKLI
jgi:N6-adenosine-specific RNA methylase IME4